MKIVTFGELLMRLSPPGRLRFSQATSYEAHFGGAEANIAVSLAQLGNDVRYITAVPDNEIGKSALREVSKWGVDTKAVRCGGKKMGLYFLEHGASLRGGNVIYDREGSAFAGINEKTFDWDELLEDADWFHWTGISPAVSSGAARACAAAVKAANKRKIPVSCDLNYRAKLWNYGVQPKEIMPELLNGCDIVLANEDDVANYLDIKPEKSDYEVIPGFGERSCDFVSRSVFFRFPTVKYVISTLRETVNASQNRWSGRLDSRNGFISGNVHEINDIVDRIGGGDAFMAAFIHGKLHFGDDQKTLNFALAASALKLSISGDFNLLSEDEILRLTGSSKTSRISR